VDLCVELFPERKGDEEFEENCALFYFSRIDLKPYSTKDESKSYDIQKMIGTSENIFEYMLYPVLVLNFLGVTLKQRTVIAITVFVNFVVGSLKVCEFYFRYGIDYTAYI
jgi:hypothetical protein